MENTITYEFQEWGGTLHKHMIVGLMTCFVQPFLRTSNKFRAGADPTGSDGDGYRSLCQMGGVNEKFLKV
ncbi:hypothetical protein MLD38_002858 [Melastoma candidum]|uniref:Uncharacterized protein n=1 Tax=Melastoma candidum TaxID=119954 RepID=A0ACB9S0F7_9MYRT|nr:hypothetical protein MLD38_002858 [Melastoma candidum]